MTDLQARITLIGGALVLSFFIGLALIFLISGQAWVASVTPIIVIVMGLGFMAFSLLAYHLGFRRNFAETSDEESLEA